MKRSILVRGALTVFVGLAALAATVLAAAKPKLDPESEKFYQTARLIMTKEETKIFERLPDAASRKEFIADFWLKRDPDPDTPDNEYKKAVRGPRRVRQQALQQGRRSGLQHGPRPGLHLHGPAGQGRGIPPRGRLADPRLRHLVELL